MKYRESEGVRPPQLTNETPRKPQSKICIDGHFVKMCLRRSSGQAKEENSNAPESEDGGEETKNYTSAAPTMWLGAQNGW